MTFPVWVEARRGQFAASLAGVPDLVAIASTRSQAIASLREEVRQRIELGELMSLDIETTGVSRLAGSYSDDPTLEDICDEVYRQRDHESKA